MEQLIVQGKTDFETCLVIETTRPTDLLGQQKKSRMKAVYAIHLTHLGEVIVKEMEKRTCKPGRHNRHV